MKNLNCIKKIAVKYMLLICLMGGGVYYLSSCDDSYLNNNAYVKTTKNTNATKDQLKRTFGYAFAKILAKDKDVREIIKKEALKKLDYDYDVLYKIIKDEKNAVGNTIEELLLNYISQDSLSLITNTLPTLTILVPELPENIFSAELWNSLNTIPKVGIRLSSSMYVPIVDEFGKERILYANEIPAFPVVVIKENERIAVNNSPNTRQYSNSELNNTGLAFISSVFDNSISQTRSERGTNLGGSRKPIKVDTIMDPRFQILKDAYKKYPTSSAGWQRDYVYYNITPQSPNGSFKNQYREYIWGFEMLGDIQGIVNKICDQNDPVYNGNVKGIGRNGELIATAISGWTDGEFEFQVKTYVASTTAVGNEIINYFRIKASDLLSIIGKREGDVIKIYKAHTNTILFDTPIPLFSWNLEEYSSTIKMDIEEVDLPQATKSSVTTYSEFATNFKFDANTGSTLKLGGQFGGSTKSSKSITYEVTTTLGNDELGQVIINFGDAILKDTTYLKSYIQTKAEEARRFLNLSPQYYTGWYRVFVGPGTVMQ